MLGYRTSSTAQTTNIKDIVRSINTELVTDVTAY